MDGQDLVDFTEREIKHNDKHLKDFKGIVSLRGELLATQDELAALRADLLAARELLREARASVQDVIEIVTVELGAEAAKDKALLDRIDAELEKE